MPNLAVVATTITTPVTAANNPYDLWVGGVDLLSSVDLFSIRLTDSGVSQPQEMEFDVWDMAVALTIADGARVLFHDNVNDTRLFTGTVGVRKPITRAVGRRSNVRCVGVGAELDRVQVVSASRQAESDKARISFLLGSYGGASLLDHSVVNINQTNASIPAQQFRGQSLRTAIESVARLAQPTTRSYVDRFGAVHYFDTTEGTAAPFAIRMGTPAGGEIAPEDFHIEYDATGLVNAYYVLGKNAASSFWVTNGNSIDRYGRREGYIEAPDADTQAKTYAIGASALADTKDPVPRGYFSTLSPNDGWLAQQTLTVKSAPAYDIASDTTFQIVRVTTTYLLGTGKRRYEIEFGALRRSSWMKIGQRTLLQ